jgi:uncharacterized RDD family membrane protein YckC
MGYTQCVYLGVMQNKINSLIRLGNFLIDSVVIVIFIMLSSYLLRDIVSQDQMKISGIVYYFVMEYTMGQTIGKILTKSKVVDVKNKGHPKFIQIFIRTLSRLIPVDFVSYLFNKQGIHDYISKTKLIKN